MIYIGCHKVNNNLFTYYGSGTNIRKAIKEFGRHNFAKEILFEYDNSIDMLAKEAELVNNEFISRTDTYNIIVGGGTFVTDNCVNVKDKYGNTMTVHKNNVSWLSGEYVGVTAGTITVRDVNGNTSKVSIDNKDYQSGKLVHIANDYVVVKDVDENILHVHKTDPRYLYGDLVGVTKGYTHKPETISKMSEKASLRTGNKNSMYGKTHSVESKKQTSDKLKGVGAKKFYVYDLTGKFISEESGIKEYADKNNINRSSIIAVLNGRYKSAGGMKFFYEYQGLQTTQ